MNRSFGYVFAAAAAFLIPSLALANATLTYDATSRALVLTCDDLAPCSVGGTGDVTIGCTSGTLVYNAGVTTPPAAAVNCGNVASITVNGGAGDDYVNLNGVNVAFSSTIVVTMHGNGGKDKLTGSQWNDVIHGGEGDDRLYGVEGNDELHGDAGDDVLAGGSGDDTLKELISELRTIGGEDGAEYGQLFGGAGNDTAVLTGSDAAETIYITPPSGTGDYQYYYSLHTSAVTTTRAGIIGDTMAGMTEKIIIDFGGGDDTFNAAYSADLAVEVNGGAGNDTVAFAGGCALGQALASTDIETNNITGGYTFAPATINVPGNATSATINAATTCTGSWTATTSDPWITVGTASGSDAANFTINLTLQPNTGAERTGHVVVNGYTVTVVQAAAASTGPTGGTNTGTGNTTGDNDNDNDTTPDGNRGGCNAGGAALPGLVLMVLGLRRRKRS